MFQFQLVITNRPELVRLWAVGQGKNVILGISLDLKITKRNT